MQERRGSGRRIRHDSSEKCLAAPVDDPEAGGSFSMGRLSVRGIIQAGKVEDRGRGWLKHSRGRLEASFKYWADASCARSHVRSSLRSVRRVSRRGVEGCCVLDLLTAMEALYYGI